jgi:hypothetical protein
LGERINLICVSGVRKPRQLFDKGRPEVAIIWQVDAPLQDFDDMGPKSRGLRAEWNNAVQTLLLSARSADSGFLDQDAIRTIAPTEPARASS